MKRQSAMLKVQKAVASKDFEAAARLIDELLRDKHELTYDQNLTITNIFLNVGRLRDALESVERARNLNPRGIGAAQQAFWIFYADSALDDAEKVLSLIRSQDSSADSVDIYNRWELLLADKKRDFHFVIDKIEQSLVSLSRDAHRGDEVIAAYIRALCEEFRVDDALVLISSLPDTAVKSSLPLSFALAKALEFKGSVDDCLSMYTHVVERFQNYEAQWNKALVLLAHGRLLEGWTAYEDRWKWKGYPSVHWAFHRQAWDGEDLRGKTLLVVNEQGLGDELMFLTKIPLIDKYNPKKIIIQVSSKIVSIVRDWYPNHVIVQAQSEPDLSIYSEYKDVDYCTSMASLSLIQIKNSVQFDQTFLSFESREQIRSQIFQTEKDESSESRILVGLSWRSSNFFGQRADLYFNHLAAENIFLSASPKIKFVCLQYRLAEEEKEFLKSYPDVFLPNEDLFDDVRACAEYTAACDVVICPPTIIRQLAGLVRTPCITWGIDPSWSHLGKDHYPWYPNIKLIKCDRRFDVGTLVERLKSMIARLPSLINC